MDLMEELDLCRERQEMLREQLLDEFKAECRIIGKLDKKRIKFRKQGASDKALSPLDVQSFFRRQGVHIPR